VKAAARRCKYINLYWKESIMKRNYHIRGFTIVELLTVMAVIALLIGLLVPGLNKVRIYAKSVKQKAQFHSISVALEMFRNDDGEYPPSTRVNGANGYICGANRLAEALVGRDLQGFDPQTHWHPSLETANGAYSISNSGSPTSYKIQSLERRKGPYLSLESIGAFNAIQFYGSGNTGNDLYPGSEDSPPTMPPAPMLSDIYAVKTVTYTNTTTNLSVSVKAGSPIIYLCARPLTVFKYDDPENSIYNYYDVAAIFDLGKTNDPTKTHPFKPDASGVSKLFYDKITNPAIPTLDKPYNANSFLLLSAGYDGLYGTSDDIWNFGE
jgi:prepilin-type N-terminal cleavage/methylation domain-containing protein